MRQSTIKTLTSFRQSASKQDFFGIRNITSKDLAAAFTNKTLLHHAEIKSKYQPLVVSRNRLANDENVENVTYGQIRRDDQNQPATHGQYDLENKDKLFNSVTVKQRYVPDIKVEQSTESDPSSEEITSEEVDNHHLSNPAYIVSEVQPIDSLGNILSLFRSDIPEPEVVAKYANKPPLTFFYHQSVSSSTTNPKESREFKESRHKPSKPDIFKSKSSPLSEKRSASTDKGKKVNPEEDLFNHRERALRDENVTHDVETKMDHLPMQESKFDRTLDRKYDIDKLKKDKPSRKLASDYVATHRDKITKLQRHSPLLPQMKFDSKGMRNYSYLVPDWYNARKVDILDFLRRSIIYHNYDILAINKPYGLASHVEAGTRDNYDMNGLVGELAKSMFKINEVFLAHRLDKTTTGILLFATSKDRARILHKQFRSDEIKKTYVALARGIPNPDEGIVDIPIGEMTVAGKTIMCPVPEKFAPERQLVRHFAEARRAITQYKTLSLGKGNISLIEMKPRSGVKHQIRCHLGFCLKTPILGDHKYSELGKLNPQKLPAKALQALQLRQTKARTLPIHLHAKSIVIPDSKANCEPLFIDAPLPHHFRENMKSLEIKMSEN